MDLHRSIHAPRRRLEGRLAVAPSRIAREIDASTKVFRAQVLQESHGPRGKLGNESGRTEDQPAVMQKDPSNLPPHLWHRDQTQNVPTESPALQSALTQSSAAYAQANGYQHAITNAHLAIRHPKCQSRPDDARLTQAEPRNPENPSTYSSPPHAGGARLSLHSGSTLGPIENQAVQPEVPQTLVSQYPQLAASRHAPVTSTRISAFPGTGGGILPPHVPDSDSPFTATQERVTDAPFNGSGIEYQGRQGGNIPGPDKEVNGVVTAEPVPRRDGGRMEPRFATREPSSKAKHATRPVPLGLGFASADDLRPPHLAESDKGIADDIAGDIANLPDLGPHGASSGNVSNSGLEPAVENAALAPRDIRGQVGLELDLRPWAGGAWASTRWADEEDDEELHFLSRERFLSPFIMNWVKGIPGKLETSFLSLPAQDHISHDVDPVTGQLVPPAEHGAEIRAEAETEALRFRKDNLSVNIMIQKHGKPSRKEQIREAHEAYARLKNAPTALCPVKDIEKPKPVVIDPLAPKITVHLRPARPRDVGGMAHIYQWEAKHGLQAIDEKGLNEDGFLQVYNTCQQLQMPIIVAIKGAEVLAARHKDPVAAGHIVVAFGFVSAYDTGLAGGTLENTGRMCGKIHVYVHPEYRRKNIGRAVFGKLLGICSDRFTPVTPLKNYEWVRGWDDLVYRDDEGQPHHFMRVYVEVFFKGHDDRNIAWYKDLLTQKFPFKQVAKFDKSH